MQRSKAPALVLKSLSCFWLVMAADWLFYNEPLGWTAGFFALLALATLCLTCPAMIKSAPAKALVLLLAGIAAAIVAEPGLLPLSLFAAGMTALILLHKRGDIDDAALFAKDVIRFWALIPFQWARDRRLIRSLRLKKLAGGLAFRLIMSRALLPLGLTAVFCWLFVTANPVLARLAALVDWGLYFGSLFSPLRWGFWLLATLVAWAMLRPRSRLAAPVSFSLGKLNLSRWIDKNSLVLSLLAFNLIFAVQNGLDIAFLWAGQGQSLPQGLTYAQYAHAGAYPLIVTALLAGAYVLVTFDENQRQYQTPAARALVALWVMQNIFLVVSSIDRTLAYIEIYSLTYLRIAALIWMGLVAAGLGLIIVRILLRLSNRWLVNMNTLVLVCVLYVCCFINFDRIIADYNVRHAAGATGQGAGLDVAYLKSLGPDAIPALRWYVLQPHAYQADIYVAAQATDELESGLLREGWREWTLRRQAVIDLIKPQKEKTRAP